MKCDVAIYSKTSAIGLFWFENWYDEPSVMFIYEAKDYKDNNAAEWTDKNLAKIKSFAEVCIEDEALVTQLKEKVKEGDLMPADFYKDLAAPFANIGDGDFFHSRKPVYTDLIKYCQSDAAWYMINNLEHSEKDEDKKQAFLCTKILAEEFNEASAYQLLACYYYEGTGVEKSYEPVYALMKKAAELGSESAKEWIEKNYSNKND